MNKRTIVFALVCILLVAGFYVYISYASGDPFWEEPWVKIGLGDGDTPPVDGSWGTEIKIYYLDGDVENLKIWHNTMSLFRDNKEIDYFKFIVYGKGVGTGYTQCSIDMTSFFVKPIVQKEVSEIWESSVKTGSINTINLDNQWHEIFSVQLSTSEFFDFDNGSYILSFNTSGSITMKGLPDGDWFTVGIPTGKNVGFIKGEGIGEPPEEPTEDPWVIIDETWDELIPIG